MRPNAIGGAKSLSVVRVISRQFQLLAGGAKTLDLAAKIDIDVKPDLAIDVLQHSAKKMKTALLRQ